MSKQCVKYGGGAPRFFILALFSAMFLLGCAKKSDAPQGYKLIEKNSEVTIYAETDSRIPAEYSRGKVWMRVVRDYKSPRDALNVGHKFEYLSTSERNEYDCDNNEQRSWFISYHDKAMLKGEWTFFDLKKTDNPMLAWGEVNPSSVDYKLKMFACEKRDG